MKISPVLAIMLLSATTNAEDFMRFADPIIITNRAGLAAISTDLAGSYRLEDDIDLGGADWTPIGDALRRSEAGSMGRGTPSATSSARTIHRGIAIVDSSAARATQ